MALNDLINVFMRLRSSMEGLSKDVDENDSREETGQDLQGIAAGFDEIKAILGSLDQSDYQKLQGEVMELMQGKETFQEYMRDVNKILTDVRTRTKTNKSTKKKIANNLPSQLKGQDVDSVFSNYEGIFKQINSFLQAYQRIGG